MRTLEELRSAVSTRGSMRRSVSAAQILDLIAHVQQQAEQLATLTRDVDSLDKEGHLPCSLTARVAALEARADARDEIDEVDAEAMLDAKDWPAPAAHPSKLDEVPVAVTAQLATLTARVAALEARAREADELRKTLAGMAAPPAKLDEAPLGVGARVLIPGEVVRVDDGDCTSLVKLRSIGDQHVLWFLRQDLRPEPANTSLTCVLCRSVEPQEGRVHTIRRHGKGHTSCDCAPAAPPAKLDEAPLGVGARVLIPGEVDEVDTDGSLRVRYSAMGSDAYHAWCRAEQVRPEPAAPPPPAAPAPASDDYEARARAWADRVRVGRRDPLVASVAYLLHTVADEARREERAACEAVCGEVAEEYAEDGEYSKQDAADDCADRIAARGKGE